MKCARVWGPNTLSPTFPHISSLTFPYISPYQPHTPTHFPTPPLIPLPTSPHTPTHFPTPIPISPSPSQSMAKLPCDEVSVAKLPWRSYHVAKLLATLKVWRSYHVTSLPCYYLAKFLWRSYWQPNGWGLYELSRGLRFELGGFGVRPKPLLITH